MERDRTNGAPSSPSGDYQEENGAVGELDSSEPSVQPMLGEQMMAPGSSPGTLMIASNAEQTVVRVIEYSPEIFREYEINDLDTLRDVSASQHIFLIEVQGLGTEEKLRHIAEIFDIHPLAIEDMVNIPQRPKVESYPNHVLYISRLVVCSRPGDIDEAQVSFLVGRNYIITFQERFPEVFNLMRDRIRKSAGRHRKSGVDYLLYSLIDSVIDHYFPVLEQLGEYFEELETRIIENPSGALFHDIHRLRHELLGLRRAIWPQRDALNVLIRDQEALLTEGVKMYFRDCYDHCVQIVDVSETYRELAGGLVEIYLTSLSNRLNEVMKVLTIISTIFIPLSFITGLYGMNFENMPELKSSYGYPIVLGVMFISALVMLTFFYRRGWLGSSLFQTQSVTRRARRIGRKRRKC